jgi:hypothetical protein
MQEQTVPSTFLITVSLKYPMDRATCPQPRQFILFVFNLISLKNSLRVSEIWKVMHLNVDLWANCVSFGPNSFGPTWAGFCLTLAVICILVGLCTVVRRIFFHPLSGFPGPWIAASSQWFEFYYDVVRGGKFSQVYHGLHVKYGKWVLFPNLQLCITLYV